MHRLATIHNVTDDRQTQQCINNGQLKTTNISIKWS